MTTKIRRKKKEIPVGRPSIFFIVALALGVALLVWVAYQAVTHPMTPLRMRVVVGMSNIAQ